MPRAGTHRAGPGRLRALSRWDESAAGGAGLGDPRRAPRGGVERARQDLAAAHGRSEGARTSRRATRVTEPERCLRVVELPREVVEKVLALLRAGVQSGWRCGVFGARVVCRCGPWDAPEAQRDAAVGRGCGGVCGVAGTGRARGTGGGKGQEGVECGW